MKQYENELPSIDKALLLEKENDALGFATTCVGGAAGLLFGAAAVSSAIEKTRRDKAELVKTVHDDYTM